MSNFTDVVSRKFLNTVARFKMFEETSTVVVGFSGGADSVCLLHLINSFKDNFGYSVKAVHINHGIRGDEAKRDEMFAADFCTTFNIPFEVFTVDCIEESNRTKESLEECARRLRYDVFNKVTSAKAKIATAHNANDNAETVIFNIARGTTIKGLCGIPFVRDNIIRPLLDCSRKEIEGYCLENNLIFVTDSTNLSDDYTRNKIRHNILPVIEEMNPSFLDSFSSLGDNAYDISDFLMIQVDSLLDSARQSIGLFDRELLLKSHSAVRSEALFKAYKEFSGRCLDNKKVKALTEVLLSGGRKQLYGNDFVEVKKDYLRFYSLITENKERIFVDIFPFSVNFNGYSIYLENFENNSKFINGKQNVNMINCDNVTGKLVLRTRQPGDQFTLNRRNVTKSLKKLFCEENIPVELRDSIPVLSDDTGVVWVYGFGVNKRYLPTEESCNIVIVRGEYNDR